MAVSLVPKQQSGRSISRGTDVGDFLVGGLGRFIAIHPRDTEVGNVGGAGGRGEEDVGGLDVTVDDVEGVEVGEAGEEVVKVGLHSFQGEGRASGIVEEGIEVEGEEREDESEFAAGEGERV